MFALNRRGDQWIDPLIKRPLDSSPSGSALTAVDANR